MGYLDEQILQVERRRKRKRFYPLIAVLLCLLILGSVLTAVELYTQDRSISVVALEGTLYTGAVTGGGLSGSEQVGEALLEAAEDPLVDAIVLRVNSPGGTPSAAQEIVEDLKYARARKPVVVSMGDTATSAAYYVSAFADRIYANPDTITGGIGTLWIFTDSSDWLEKEGYAIEVVKSGESKDMTYPYRNLTPQEESYAQDLVNRSFERFVSDITSQRNISRSSIEDGRVVRGEEALSLGLVDEMGNLHQAIEGARALARSR